MKIWIDLTNSPHVNFFKPFISKWKSQNIDVVITTRDLANTIDLIEQNQWDYTEIGGHAGKNKLMKLLYFPRRVFLLYRFFKKNKPNIAISQSSFYSPIASRLLNVPVIYMNDNEHAKGNYIAFKFATLNIIPEFLKPIAVENKWDKKFNIDYYPGIKEGIYLSQYSYFKNDQQTTENKKIYIRLEPWTAQYYRGKNEFLDDLIVSLKEQYSIVILPRGIEQSKHYHSNEFKGVVVAQKPIPLEVIFQDCALFIGAGGSMTRELAFLGIPTLSVYQDKLLEVDKFLIENQFMVFSPNPTLEEIANIINKLKTDSKNELHSKGIEAFAMINKIVFKYAKN